MSKTKNDVDMFERNYTQRGFRILTFHDTNENNECSLQESSDALNECVWLGISKPDIQIMYKDALAAGLNLKKKYPETNECGWCDLPLPEGTLISSRMHLTREQARKLAHELFFFGRHGYLDCKEGERISEHGNKAMKKINEIILEPQSNLVEPSFPYQQNYVENGFEYFSYIAKIPIKANAYYAFHFDLMEIDFVTSKTLEAQGITDLTIPYFLVSKWVHEDDYFFAQGASLIKAKIESIEHYFISLGYSFDKIEIKQ